MITRRTFIISGAISILGLSFFTKKHLIQNNDLKSFLNNYDVFLPNEDILPFSDRDQSFEDELVSMISSIGLDNTQININEKIINDYKLQRIQLMNRWIVSETEFNLLILVKKYV